MQKPLGRGIGVYNVVVKGAGIIVRLYVPASLCLALKRL